jgi:hypothetical protein
MGADFVIIAMILGITYAGICIACKLLPLQALDHASILKYLDSKKMGAASLGPSCLLGHGRVHEGQSLSQIFSRFAVVLT